mgnify:FL=1|tara:strand:- start:636 stop:932 length:297 start_codon:yes stop_codon:yes gene_type:complete
MDSIIIDSNTAPVTKPKPKRSVKKAPVIKTYDSLEKGFKQHSLKCKRVGDDWRFSTGSTLRVDVKPGQSDLQKVVEYMVTHPGTKVNVNVSSILRGCK